VSIEKVREYLKQWNKEDEILEFDVSSATVDLAAKALQTEESRIAKTLAFKIGDRAILVIPSVSIILVHLPYSAYLRKL
jgi:prolyl-tRNA editing enzyme YbaK/EbsC (Cys-tRNA(Pro) deacylase)